MTVRYSIRNWKERFEVSQAAKVKSWSWVALPNKHDGLGFRRIMALPDGMTVYAAWVLMVQIASKCPARGILSDENGPLDATDLSLKTGAPKEAFERALNALADNRIGWILVEQYDDSSSLHPLQDRTVHNSTEQDKTVESASPSTIAEFPELCDWLNWWNELKSFELVPAGVNSEEPSQGAIAGWKRVQKDKRLRALLADRDAIRREIEASTFCREPWFTFDRLLGGKNREGAWIVQKLLEGGYRDHKPRTVSRIGAGQTHDPRAAEKDPTHGTF